jgi:hypothetical protein
VWCPACALAVTKALDGTDENTRCDICKQVVELVDIVQTQAGPFIVSFAVCKPCARREMRDARRGA